MFIVKCGVAIKYIYCVLIMSLSLSFLCVGLTQALTGLNVSQTGFNLQFLLWLAMFGGVKYFLFKKRRLSNETCKA